MIRRWTTYVAEHSGAARFRARVVNPVLRAVLRSPLHRMLSGSVLLLEYIGRRSGRRYTLPVMYVSAPDHLVVAAGDPSSKTWWRNFTFDPQPVSITLHGRRSDCSARSLTAGTDERAEAVQAYQQRFPRVTLDPASPVIALLPGERHAGKP
jgi:deazaflavin-dependent oxidoreductase (nitroreductase family)